jgi:ABC-2 type transport system ATP-binding protein
MMSGPEVAVDLRGVHVRRGGRHVLRDVSAVIETGTVVGLVGPSGSGKTTLIRAVVGLQREVTGAVTVLGRPAGTASLRAEVGYVTQSPAIYGDLSIRHNLEYFAAVIGAPRTDVARVLGEVGLADRADDGVDRLSGGQQARVSLATALLGRPRLLVLDEPTVGLDPVLRAELWQLFRSLADAGTTLLVSSHVMDEAARCQSVILLRDGAVLAHDSPAHLLERTGAADLDEAFLRLVAA